MINQPEINGNSYNYQTSDTPLAAYLISSGAILLFIEYVNGRAIFNFQSQDKNLEKLIRQYKTAGAVGNIVAYEQARRELVRRVKRGQR